MKEDGCVVRVDDVEHRASQTETHSGLEPSGDLHACDWHVFVLDFFY
jgi:hypothetical protein